MADLEDRTRLEETQRDGRTSLFLRDTDLFIRTFEAARAIHDLPIESEYPALAEVLTKLPTERMQEADHLLRRAIHAAYRLGTAEQAERILEIGVQRSDLARPFVPKPLACSARLDRTRPA